MWSKLLLCRFLQSGKIQQTPVSQGFAAFHLALSRIPPRRSQMRRGTNSATPGYSISDIIPRRGGKSKIFCLWSFLWSKPLLCRLQQPGKVPQTQASQGFASFRLTLSRIPPRRSQTRRDTSFAIPGYSASAIIPRRGEKSKAFSRCGHLCAQYILDK